MAESSRTPPFLLELIADGPRLPVEQLRRSVHLLDRSRTRQRALRASLNGIRAGTRCCLTMNLATNQRAHRHTWRPRKGTNRRAGCSAGRRPAGGALLRLRAAGRQCTHCAERNDA